MGWDCSRCGKFEVEPLSGGHGEGNYTICPICEEFINRKKEINESFSFPCFLFLQPFLEVKTKNCIVINLKE